MKSLYPQFHIVSIRIVICTPQPQPFHLCLSFVVLFLSKPRPAAEIQPAFGVRKSLGNGPIVVAIDLAMVVEGRHVDTLQYFNSFSNINDEIGFQHHQYSRNSIYMYL